MRFIEYMDVGNLNQWQVDEVVTADEIVERIGAEFPLEPLPPNYPGEVANRFRYRDGGGEIGVIASVSQPFCGACTRARLSTDGQPADVPVRLRRHGSADAACATAPRTRSCAS